MKQTLQNPHLKEDVYKRQVFEELEGIFKFSSIKLLTSSGNWLLIIAATISKIPKNLSLIHI